MKSTKSYLKFYRKFNTSHKNYLLLPFIFLLSSSICFAGGFVGNGGDVIECSASSDSFLNGTYSLDYVLTLADAHEDKNLVSFSSWQASASRIEKLIKDKVPGLASSFSEFKESFLNSKDYSKRRIWEPSPFGLRDIKDEELVSLVPPNCLTQGKVVVTQAVIKQSPVVSGVAKTVLYKYVPSIVSKLAKDSPMQLSFLMVHEWLWEVTSNVDRNRRLNRFLHSADFESLTAAQVTSFFKSVGFYPPGVQLEVYEKSSCVGPALTQDFLKKKHFDTSVVKAGKGLLHSRQRALTCVSNAADCGKQWMSTFALEAVHDSKNTLDSVFRRSDTGSDFVLNIVSLVHGMRGPNSVAPVLSCELQSDPVSNLSCTIEDSKIVHVLTGVSSAQPKSSWPKLSGFATSDCIRIEAFRNQEVLTGGLYVGTEIWETQSVFFLR